MSSEAQQRLNCPEKYPSSWSGSTDGHGWPSELSQRAVSRLGWVAVIYASLFVAFYALYKLVGPDNPLLVLRQTAFRDLTIAGIVLGVLMAWLAFSRRLPPCAVLDLGLLFQIFGAIPIGLAEAFVPVQQGAVVWGHSAIAIWITVCALLMPNVTWKIASAAILTASMGPLTLEFAIRYLGVPPPDLSQRVIMAAAPFFLAVACAPLAGYIFQLGKHVTRARELGSYEMIELIGSGGMGEVWRARHRFLTRQSAVKLIRPDILFGGADPATARQRFEREARATAALSSPNTITLYDYGVSGDGVFYYAMELLNGVDLSTLVDRWGPVSAGRTVYILKQVCDSLAEAHENGLTHRDIKPKNIFLCRLGVNHDFVKVLDFGLAKSRGGDMETQLTRDGVTTGTPAFLPPEMALGKQEVDERTDIYALGCVAYFLLTGQLVFNAPTALAMALAHVQQTPELPSRRTEMEIPPSLESIVMQCLEKDPVNRPQTARRLARMLGEIGLDGAWDAAMAEEWWLIHRPSLRNTAEPTDHAVLTT
jgi:eukaryotic-like serine/threonine-protein kinase